MSNDRTRSGLALADTWWRFRRLRWLSVQGSALLFFVLSAAFAEESRFVPQLGLTSLDPVKVAFHPRDRARLLIVNQLGRIDLLDIANKDRPIKTAEIGARAMDATFNPAGDRILSGETDGTLRLWTLDGQPAAEPFEGHQGLVWSVAFNPVGDRIVSGGADGTLRLWTLDGQPAAAPFQGHQDWVRSVAFNPAGDRIISGGADGTLRLWTLDGQSAAAPFEGHQTAVWSVAFNPTGDRIISGGADGTLRLWILGGQPAAAPFQGHQDWVRSVAFNPAGDRIVSGGDDGSLRLWTLDGQPVAAPFQGHQDWVLTVAFNPVGDRIISGGDDGSLRLWTLDGQPAAAPFQGHQDMVLTVAFNPAGDRIISGGADGTLRLWTLDGQPAAAPFQGHQDWVRSVAFNPAGDRIISGGADGTLRLWTLDGQPAAAPFQGHQDWVRSVAFNPAGDRIISGGADGTLRLWTLDGQPAAAPFQGHQDWVRSVAFNPAGDRIISGGADGTLRLWTLDGQPAAAPFEGHQGLVLTVAFNPAGDRIVSGGADGTVRVWEIGASTRVVLTCGNPRVDAVREEHWAVHCSDRVVLLDAAFEKTGVLFLHRYGLVVLTDHGVLAPSAELHILVRAFGEGGTMRTRVDAVPALPVEQVRQDIYNEYRLGQRVLRFTTEAWQRAAGFYSGLGWLKVPFWPALGWTLVAASALTLWLFAPARLAAGTMPLTGAPPPPQWKWLMSALSLYGWLGVTRRPLRAWLRRHREALTRSAFLERRPVKERERYCPLGHDTMMDEFAKDLDTGRAVCWIDGSGGSGKSALAFKFARTQLVDKLRAPLPVLIDADWDGSVAAEVARQLRLPAAQGVDEREPTEIMARVLGAMGLVCPIVDSLEARGDDAVQRVSSALRDGIFRHLIVTSRHTPPTGLPWENRRRIQPMPIQRKDLSLFIRTYTPDLAANGNSGSAATSLEEIRARIDPLVGRDPLPSPLFLRFAIEQAEKGPGSSTGRLDLVMDYLEALREDRTNLNSSDMLRAASITALEATREDGVPREVNRLHLQGVLQGEADRTDFMDAGNTHPVVPAAVIDSLLASGVLNQTRSGHRLQFAYDPVSEFLAAHWLYVTSDLQTLRNTLLASDSPVREAYREISADRMSSQSSYSD